MLLMSLSRLKILCRYDKIFISYKQRCYKGFCSYMDKNKFVFYISFRCIHAYSTQLMDFLSFPGNRYGDVNKIANSNILIYFFYCRFKFICPPAGLPLLYASLRLSSAEEYCDAAAQQCSAEPGENHTETTAPSSGDTQHICQILDNY